MMQPVLRSVSMPAQLLLAPKYATIGALGSGLVIWLILDDPIAALTGTFGLWLCGMGYGFKDPHFMEILAAKFRIRKTRNLDPFFHCSKVHYYAG